MHAGIRIWPLMTLIFASADARAGFYPQDSFSKNFRTFREVAPGVTFFAGNPADVQPFVKPLSEARHRLGSFLGKELSPGAVVLCTSLAQRDSVNEARILKMGHKWVLIQLTAEASRQQMLAQIRAQAAGQIPPRMLERLQNQTPEMKKTADRRLISSTVQRYAAAALMATLAPDKPFRSSRIEDAGRSPLSDWLDVGLAAYAAANSNANLRFLQERLEESFPLEDVLAMSRPFAAPAAGPSFGGGDERVVIMLAPGTATGEMSSGAQGPGAARMAGGAGMPKDLQDRICFDAQAATFFYYLVQQLGTVRVKEMVQWNLGGKEVREYLVRPEILGSDLEKIERDWHDWIRKTEAESPGIRIMERGPRPDSPPE